MKKIVLCLLLVLKIGLCNAQIFKHIEHIIAKEKQEWINSWKKNPLLDIQLVDTDKISPMVGLGNSYNSINDVFYKYSPSRKHFVDIYSRSFMIEVKGGDTILTGLDPDCEVVLFNSKHEHSRLLFEGSMVSYEDVVWITDSTFVVLGCYTEENMLNPIIIFFDISKMKMYYFIGSSNEMKYNYLDKKFRTMKCR
jgi:hypothetical protein